VRSRQENDMPGMGPSYPWRAGQVTAPGPNSAGGSSGPEAMTECHFGRVVAERDTGGEVGRWHHRHDLENGWWGSGFFEVPKPWRPRLPHAPAGPYPSSALTVSGAAPWAFVTCAPLLLKQGPSVRQLVLMPVQKVTPAIRQLRGHCPG
jgi:hypothetical protein